MQGTSRAQRLMNALGTEKYTYQVVANRPIAGTNKASEHSYGNAVDIFAEPSLLQDLAFLLNGGRGKFDIDTLCWDGKGQKYDKCTTPHLDHIHVDFRPSCGGYVPTGGTDTERIAACESYQNTQAGNIEEGGGFLENLNPLSGLEEGVNRVLVVAAGIALGVGAIVLMMGDLKMDSLTKLAGKVIGKK